MRDSHRTLLHVMASSGHRDTSTRVFAPPHAELPLIRTTVESLRYATDRDLARGEAEQQLTRAIEQLAAILDLHGEFGAADEARAIVASFVGCGLAAIRCIDPAAPPISVARAG